MTQERSQSGPSQGAYISQTRRPLNNLILVAPLLAAFHIGAEFYKMPLTLLAPRYVAQLLNYFGAPAMLLAPALVVVIVLFFQQLAQREKWTIQPQAVAGMVGESILWTIPLIAISYLTGRIPAQAAGDWARQGMIERVLVSLGAGIYEEFIFRMVLISLLLLVLVDLLAMKKDVMTVLAVLAAAVLFGLCHFHALGGSWPFEWGRFIFLSIAGVLWGALFLYRGIGIAIGSHIAWDLYVLLATPRYGITALFN